MLLSRNEKFLKEYNQFKTKIDQIANENIRRDANNLLNELSNEISKLDQLHQNLTLGIKFPSDMGGHREKIQGLRKRLAEKLK